MVSSVVSLVFVAAGSFGATDAAGGHAAAPAAAAVHSAPVAVPAQSESHVMNPSAGEGRAEPTGINPAAHGAVQESTSNRQTNGDHRTTSQQHRHDFDHQYNVIYGDPWYGYNGGWNSGWYGNGYSNNGYYNDVTFSPSNNSAPADNSGSLPETPAPTQSAQTPAGSEAEVVNEVDHSPQMTAANTAVQSAQTAYDSARQQVLAKLKSNPQYQQALAQRHQASSNLRAAKASPSSMPTIVDAASAKMNAADEVTRMEESAIAGDPSASAAKMHLDQVVAARDALRADMLVHH